MVTYRAWDLFRERCFTIVKREKPKISSTQGFNPICVGVGTQVVALRKRKDTKTRQAPAPRLTQQEFKFYLMTSKVSNAES